MEKNIRHNTRLLKKIFNKFFEFINQRVEAFGAQYIILGIFGILNYPIYYLIWKYYSYQSYENVWLRLIATFLCLFLLLKNYWPKKIKKYFSLYWILTIWFCLSFFFFFMLFKNNGATVWLMSTNTILFWLALIVDWVLYIIILLTGIVFALLSYYLTTHHPFLSLKIYSEGIIAQFIGSFLVVLLFARNKQHFERTKLETMKSLGATLAHELRTPLATIQSGVMALKNHVPEVLKTYRSLTKKNQVESVINDETLEIIPEVIESVSEEANHASIIIEMLLTSIQQQEIKKDVFQAASIFECIDYSLTHYSFLPSQKEKIIWKPNENKDFKFFGDKLLIAHVLFNLLKNALYFLAKSQKGQIYVWLTETTKYNELHFKDTGPGIPKIDLPRIFDRFFTKGTHRGTGIGLAFCKMVMEAHNGKISCFSQQGEYVEFILSFPK